MAKNAEAKTNIVNKRFIVYFFRAISTEKLLVETSAVLRTVSEFGSIVEHRQDIHES
jgi:hypothetical protein